MKNNKVLYPLLAIAALIIATLACGGDNTGEKVGESETLPTSAPPQVQVYQMGDVIQVGEHTIVLNSAEFQANVLKANFTIENKGAEEMNVSSLMEFEAKDTEGTKLEQEWDCSPSLGGGVLSGDKLKGDVCWSGAATDVIKIYYRSELFGSGAVVWEVKK